MPDLKVGIVLEAFDRATAPLKGLSRSARSTKSALGKLGDQAAMAGKLGSLRSGLGKTAAKLDIARRRTSELGRQFKSAESPSKKLIRQFELSQRSTIKLARAHKRQKGELRELSGKLRDAGVDTRGLASEQERLGRASERLTRRLERQKRKTGAASGERLGGLGLGFLGGLAGSAAFAGIGAARRSALDFVGTASMFETLEATLGTIEGSSAKAERSMGWISDFATKTPFELDQVSEAFVKLRAYGMDPTGGLLRSLGDTASAMGKDVMQAVEAIADAVTGENERLKEFGIKARTKGDTITYEYTLKGKTRTATANARDRAEIQRVLAGIMDSKYSGSMEARMKTFSGMVSNLSDQWTRFQSKVMESGPFDILKDRLGGVLDRINQMADSGELGRLAESVGDAAVKAFDAFEKDVWPALKSVSSTLLEIFRIANRIAEAFGGWGNAIKAFAAYKLLGAGVSMAGAVKGRVDTARDLWGGLRDAAGSSRAKRIRGSARGLASSAIGKAGSAFSRIGKTLGSLALRFAPLATGALKALGAVVAGITGPVAAAAAAIGIAGWLIWKNWEPIKGFFAKLWEGVKSAFSSAWEWISEMDWLDLGKRLMTTLARGIRDTVTAPWNALKGALGKLRELLPGSDARRGPLSRLTASGASILSTMGEGVRRAGPRPLGAQLSRALGTATAGLALSLPAPSIEIPRAGPSVASSGGPVAAGPVPSKVVHYRAAYHITIVQRPGEDARELARRVADELERRRRDEDLGSQYDAD